MPATVPTVTPPVNTLATTAQPPWTGRVPVLWTAEPDGSGTHFRRRPHQPGHPLVLQRYDGGAAHLWTDEPTAAELRQRLQAFPGIGQKKAAMAAEILARDLHKEQAIPIAVTRTGSPGTATVPRQTGILRCRAPPPR